MVIISGYLQRVQSEITPVSVSLSDQSNADNAIDREISTSAYVSGSNTWFKATLDKKFCIEEVRHYYYSTLSEPYNTQICSRDTCTCVSGSHCAWWPVTVYPEDGLVPDNTPSDCKIGDTVVIDGSSIGYTDVNEIVIIGRIIDPGEILYRVHRLSFMKFVTGNCK